MAYRVFLAIGVVKAVCNWSRLKYLNNCLMDCHQISYIHGSHWMNPSDFADICCL